MKSKIIILAIVIIGVLIAIYGKDYLYQKAESLKQKNEAEIVNPHAAQSDMDENKEVKPFYHGVVMNFENGGGYTYIEVKEKTEKTFWIAVERADVKKGDYIQFQKELVMHNFKSKALNRTFDEIMFASHLYYKVPE